MRKRLLLLAVTAVLSLALFAPAALAQDDDNDDDGAVTAPAAPLPDTGGPALAVPTAGALLIGAGAAGMAVLRRKRGDS